jgi:hypothetical protein
MTLTTRKISVFSCMFVLLTTCAFATVAVSRPGNGWTVGSPVNYVATATTSCPSGVASMGIYVENQLKYVSYGSSLNTNLSFNPGTYNTVVEEWDHCGGATYTPVKIIVSGWTPPTLYNLQASGGWVGYGEFPPSYNICTQCGGGVTYWMGRGVKSPSLSGNATQYYVGGWHPYSDVLWTNPLIGQNSTQGLPDSNHTMVQNLHNFTYDLYFYGGNLPASQILEFDISQYFSGMSFIWGTQCRIAGGHMWDIWDNVNNSWVSTGVPCNPVNGGWNHLTIQVQRESDNWLLYKSITLNGVTANINRYEAHGSAPGGWWGVTVNYQMDGDYKQTPYTTFVDNFKFSYY